MVSDANELAKTLEFLTNLTIVCRGRVFDVNYKLAPLSRAAGRYVQ